MYPMLFGNLIWSIWTYSNPLFFLTNTSQIPDTVQISTDGTYAATYNLIYFSDYIYRFLPITALINLYNNWNNVDLLQYYIGQTWRVLPFDIILALIIL